MRRLWSIPFCALALFACARNPAPPLAGPSSAPVMELPKRVALLSQYIRINTTNPPGDELLAARWLAEVLKREGIERPPTIIALMFFCSDQRISARRMSLKVDERLRTMRSVIAPCNFSF